MASKRGYTSIMNYLFSAFKKNILKIDQKKYYSGMTCAMFAAKNNQVEALKVLKAQGANFYLTLKDHKTVLHIAAERGNVETVKYLVDEKVFPDINHFCKAND